jgi:hypothetical protein
MEYNLLSRLKNDGFPAVHYFGKQVVLLVVVLPVVVCMELKLVLHVCNFVVICFLLAFCLCLLSVCFLLC